MTRKNRKKKRYSACFVFTSETLHLAQEALKLLEQPLQQADHQHAKVQFAAEIVDQVTGKLETLRQPLGLRCFVTFDYNEKIMLRTAIQLYIANQLFLPLNTQRARVLRQCQQMAVYFTMDNAR